ncbi:MAG TPA: hypothetical protein DDZ39_10680 [Flavobacteriaceae bacterium]|jgi:glycosyltransferase involved in cell wall biosynthesis|nr:hypothetical protein [Flavobacteriaceae bacterium]HBS11914.1 hypothetical protein [Flavobacteriaceae bacterium]
MTKQKKILVISHLYLFPNSKLRRGGLIIHESLVNFKRTGKNMEVLFFLPFIWSYLKYFNFNWKKFNFSPYEIDNIIIHPIFYIPRLSKVMKKLDLYLKMLAFNFFYLQSYNEKNGFEFVYGQTLYPDGPLLSKISKKVNSPYIVNMRGSDIHSYSANNTKIHSQSIKVLNESKLVLAVSEKLKDTSIDIFGKNYVSHILYTICQINTFKKNRPISNSLNNIIYIGALVESKGVYDLIEAISLLSKSKKYKLNLVGSGDRKRIDKLLKIKKISNIVSFKGEISNRDMLVEEINKADILLFPSHNEGLPNAVVECVACERIVICTDVGGVREITNQNLAFQVIQPKNINAIIEAIKKLETVTVEELRRQANRNRKKILERFSPDSQLITFRKILEKIGKKS